jgi:dTDP-glucose pyrophosphorylase
MTRQAVILAGGLGTRLRTVIGSIRTIRSVVPSF